MAQASTKEKIRYYFENTLSKGPQAVIKWLAIASLTVVIVLAIVIVIFGIKSSDDPDASQLGFIEGAWQILMSTIDPGAMGGDGPIWPFRFVRLIATMASLFLISILIGSISSGIDSKLGELKKGKSKVLESNHTLILGWSEKIFSIISEIIEANSNQKKPAIVILADRDKEEMDDEIRSKIENFRNTKIIVRSGSPLESGDIAVVNPHEARSIIILASEEENADTYTIKSVLALTNGKHRKKEKYNIVAEIKDEKNLEAAELVGNDETIYVLSTDLISRITAQTCRQSGLSVVYSEILKFDGDEIYFHEENKLVGKTFKDSLFAYETSSVIGVYNKAKNALINPGMNYVFEKGDKVIAISEDDDKVILSGKTEYKIKQDVFSTASNTEKQKERTLILGWNKRGVRIIEEMDNYVSQGSEVMIVANNEGLEEQLSSLKSSIKNQKVAFQQGEITDKTTLVSLKTETYDHIIVLSYTDIEVQESDAKTLICLLHLRNLSEQANKDYSIVSEMLDIRNRELGVVAKADDFIVSDNLISLILSQLSENSELKKVYDVLFEAEGSEIYLKPITNYVKADSSLNFYTVLESATLKNEIAIGYRLTKYANEEEHNFGVKLNPNKAEEIKFSADDFLIVIAED